MDCGININDRFATCVRCEDCGSASQLELQENHEAHGMRLLHTMNPERWTSEVLAERMNMDEKYVRAVLS